MFCVQENMDLAMPVENTVLRLIYDRHSEETIPDEQMRRVFEPVGAMILAGKFKRPVPGAVKSARAFAAAAAVVALSAGIALSQAGPGDEMFATIPDAPVPLAQFAAPANMLSGRVLFRGAGIKDIKLELVSESDLSVVGSALTEENGGYAFRDIPNGPFKLMAELPVYIDIGEKTGEGTWLLSDGKTELEFVSDSAGFWESVDIEIC